MTNTNCFWLDLAHMKPLKDSRSPCCCCYCCLSCIVLVSPWCHLNVLPWSQNQMYWTRFDRIACVCTSTLHTQMNSQRPRYLHKLKSSGRPGRPTTANNVDVSLLQFWFPMLLGCNIWSVEECTSVMTICFMAPERCFTAHRDCVRRLHL